VLLIACANVAGLLVARGADREREFAVRSALGASRLRLARQLLVESAALGVAGAALGILLGATILRTLVATSWFALPRTTDLSFDGAALAFAIAMAIVTPIVFGLIPSLQTARPRHGSALTSGGRTGGSAMRSRTRSTLIVVEVALAVMLVAGSTLLLRSLDRLLRIEPGFAPAGLLTVGVSLPTERYGSDLLRANFFGSLVEQVGVIPGVEHAAAAMPVPFVSDMVASLDIDDREADPETRPTSNFYAVTPGYFEAMGIRLLRGRDIALGDNRPDAARVAVVSKRLAETVLGGLDVLGRRVRISQGPRREFATVIGVAADVRQYSLDGALTSQIYEPAAQHPYFGTTHIVVRAGVPAETLVPSLRQAVASLDPLLPLGQVVLLEERIADSTGPRRSTTALLAGLAAVALLLSAVGVYGLVSFSVGRRIQEFGLRIALGAEPGAIMRLVLGEGLWLAGLGVAIGLVGALMAGRLVEAQLFQVSARDPIALAGAAFVLVSATLAACYGPARRALGVNPVSALRQS
jgi:putative ABC transport system permease protein